MTVELHGVGGECIEHLPFPALEQALFSQLEPAWSAGVALPAVSPFTCPARAVAAGTLVAVLISIIALWAVLHTGCVCHGRKNVYLDIEHDTSPLCSPSCVPWWEGGEGCRKNGMMSL